MNHFLNEDKNNEDILQHPSFKLAKKMDQILEDEEDEEDDDLHDNDDDEHEAKQSQEEDQVSVLSELDQAVNHQESMRTSVIVTKKSKSHTGHIQFNNNNNSNNNSNNNNNANTNNIISEEENLIQEPQEPENSTLELKKFLQRSCSKRK